MTLPIITLAGHEDQSLAFFRLSSAAENPYGSQTCGSHYQGQRGPTHERSFQASSTPLWKSVPCLARAPLPT